MKLIHALAALAIASGGLFGPVATAQDEAGSSTAPKTQSISEIVAEFEKRQSEVLKKARSLPRGEGRPYWMANRPDSSVYAAKIIPMIVAAPKGPDAATGIGFALSNLGGEDAKLLKTVTDIAMEHHTTNKDVLRPLLRAFSRKIDPEHTATLMKIRAANSGESLAIVDFDIASRFQNMVSAQTRYASISDDDREGFENYYGGKAALERLMKIPAKELEAKALKHFTAVIENPAAKDLKRGRRSTYADAAKSTIFELQNLSVGKTAPEIEGTDVSGTAFKLSDYRGKVIFLDFWGHW